MSDLEQLLELSLKAGASDAEVYQVSSLSRPAFFEANRLKQLESGQSQGVALRLWRENCPGLAVAYGEVDPKALVERAIAVSQLNAPETIELAPARQVTYPEMGTPLSVETLVEMGKSAIATIREQYPEVLCSGEWECDRQTTRLVNSQGLDCQYSEITLSASLGVEWVRGDDFLGIYDGQQQRDSLDPAAVVEPILQRLAWAAENVPPPKGHVPVLLTAKAADLLWNTVAAALNGKRVLENSSPWSDRLQDRVVTEGITLCQRPDFSPFDCPFDDEGTPTQPLTLIERGRLQKFYSDRTVGRALGTLSTGNGFRPGLGSYPTPSLVNLIVEPGMHTLNELIAQLDEGLIVDQLLGGGADISGDFSVNVELGYRIQKGQVVGRVKDTMVAGNVYSTLKHPLVLGSDRDWSGSCYTPSTIVEGLSVVG